MVSLKEVGAEGRTKSEKVKKESRLLATNFWEVGGGRVLKVWANKKFGDSLRWGKKKKVVLPRGGGKFSSGRSSQKCS